MFAQGENVLSSAKLWIEEDRTKKKLRSQIEVDRLLNLLVRLKWYFQYCYISCLSGHIVFDSLNRRKLVSRLHHLGRKPLIWQYLTHAVCSQVLWTDPLILRQQSLSSCSLHSSTKRVNEMREIII